MSAHRSTVPADVPVDLLDVREQVVTGEAVASAHRNSIHDDRVEVWIDHPHTGSVFVNMQLDRASALLLAEQLLIAAVDR